jgi:serine recombinase
MHYGYARVSTFDQDLSIQLDALTAAGCTVFRSRIREIRARGLGATAIAKALGIGRASVYRVLDASQ